MLFEKIDYSKIPELAYKMPTFFVRNQDIDKTSYMNWRISPSEDLRTQFWELAEGYLESAVCLIDICLQDNVGKRADIFIFPILFDIIHGIELYLKAIIDYLNIVVNHSSKMKKGHNISSLCAEAMELLIKLQASDCSQEIKDSILCMTVVKNFISIILEKTDDMTFARYPISAKDKEMFYAATAENVVVDLELLRENVVYLIKCFDMVTDFLLRYLDYLHELKQENGYF